MGGIGRGNERAGRENRVCRGLRWYSEARDEERREKGESEHERVGGWLECAGDESELPEGGLRVRWNGANVARGVGRPRRERGREGEIRAHGGWFSSAEI